MNIEAIHTDSHVSLAGARLAERYAGDSFAQQLSTARADGESQLRAAATQLVSSALLMPVMEMISESPFADGPFAPSSAEKHFQPLLNQHLTEGIVGAANFSIVDAIVERYAQMNGGAADVGT